MTFFFTISNTQKWKTLLAILALSQGGGGVGPDSPATHLNAHIPRILLYSARCQRPTLKAGEGGSASRNGHHTHPEVQPLQAGAVHRHGADGAAKLGVQPEVKVGQLG